MKNDKSKCEQCEKLFPESFLHNLTHLDLQTQDRTSALVCQKCIANFSQTITILDIDGQEPTADQKILDSLNQQICEDSYIVGNWLDAYWTMKTVVELNQKSARVEYPSVRKFLDEVGIHSDELMAFIQLCIICADLATR